MKSHTVFAVIPAYRVRNKLLEVIEKSLNYTDFVIVVDDNCPEESGLMALRAYENDSRVYIHRNHSNLGVGGATKKGFEIGFIQYSGTLGIKVDGDGQIKPELIPSMLDIFSKTGAGMVKGNRFSSPEDVEKMPLLRLVGNSALSVISKVSSGYWNLSDPTNGFIGITKPTYERLQPQKIADDYFFESDLLFRVGLVGTNVRELPMKAVYEDESSSLKPVKIIPRFLFAHNRNTFKRIAYEYLIREWNFGTISLLTGVPIFLFGASIGIGTWINNSGSSVESPVGTLFLSAVPIILGFQLLLAFVNYDVAKRR